MNGVCTPRTKTISKAEDAEFRMLAFRIAMAVTCHYEKKRLEENIGCRLAQHHRVRYKQRHRLT